MIGSITVFTSQKPSELGKVFSLLPDGQLSKKVAGNMYEGTFKVENFDSKENLAALLQAVQTNQAISASLPRTDSITGPVRTAENAANLGCLARTKKDFPFKTGPGVLTLDYDPPNGRAVLTSAELWSQLCRLCPEVVQAGAVWWSSGSSHIHGPGGELQGLKGQRLYILVQDAADIGRAGQVISDRCWQHQLGRVEISQSGQKLKRTLWDEAMHEPARLDFIGGAVCTAPLSQQRGSPVLYGGDGWLDTRLALPDLTDEERASLERIKRDALDRAQPQADVQRELWVSTRASADAIRLNREKNIPMPEALEMARRLAESAQSGTLYGDFHISLPDSKFVTVADVLDNWQNWDRKKVLDPLEPEHRNFEECGILYLSGADPCLFSFAHGGVTFRLARQPKRVEYRKGRQSQVADEFAEALASQGDIFYSGGTELVKALPGKFETLDKAAIQYLLGHRVALVTKKDKDGRDIPMNISPDLVALTVAAIGQKPSQTPPVLKAVTRLPYATAEQRLVTQAGFDAGTGIFNIMVAEQQAVPSRPTTEECIRALECIWAPWANYKWANDVDRGGMLAAIFTAVLRPAMEIAPGVFFDAPVQASGKTKAALALGTLMTGDHAGVYPYVNGRNQEEEYSKAIIALLRSDRRFWLIDNVTGLFESPVLAGLITSGRVQGRILGLSKDGNFSGRVMLCATGNNATLSSDLNRRFLRCRIDTGVERPSSVSHGFEPAHLAKATRLQIANSVLTVLQACWQGTPVTVVGGADFPEWTMLVREPVVWLQQQGLTEAAGIGNVEDPTTAWAETTCPDQLGLEQLLAGLAEVVGINKPFQARTLLDFYSDGESGLHAAKSLIREGLDNLTGGKEPTSRSLGYTLTNRRDRRACGRRLALVGTDRIGSLWQIRAD